jgi:hypothetical protein
MKFDRHDETWEPDALIDAVEFARRRAISLEQVGGLVAQHSLFSLDRDGKTLYPAFFAGPSADIQRLEAVCRRLGALPGGSKWQFFVTPKASLAGQTPLEALRDGHIAYVNIAADGLLAVVSPRGNLAVRPRS